MFTYTQIDEKIKKIKLGTYLGPHIISFSIIDIKSRFMSKNN